MKEIRPFEAQDLVDALASGIMECGAKGENDDIAELGRERELLGACYSGFIDGKLAGCGGANVFWDGVCELWMVITEHGKNHPVHTIKGVREILDKIKAQGFWRIQTTGRVGFDEANKLIELLGFKKDCVLEKYGHDKSDYYLYSMVI